MSLLYIKVLLQEQCPFQSKLNALKMMTDFVYPIMAK